MKRIYNAILVLVGTRKAYNPKTHFISRRSGERLKKKVVFTQRDNGERA